MAIINDLDLGAHPTWFTPLQTSKGQTARLKTGTVQVRGGKEFYYLQGAEFPDRAETVWISLATPAITLMRVNQLLELVGNPELNKPCFIQWASGGGFTVPNSQDGWYFILEAEPDVEFSWSTSIPVKLTVRKASGGNPRFTGVWNSGGRLDSLYSGVEHNVVAFPTNGISLIATFSRITAEGNIQLTQFDPVANPAPFYPSPVIADWFKGGCRVFDAMAIMSVNPVGVVVANPSFELLDSADSTLPANWVRNNVGTGTATLDTGNPHTGSSNLHLTGSPSSGGGVYSRIGIPVRAGQNVTFSAWMKGGSAGLTGACDLVWTAPGSTVSTTGVATGNPYDNSNNFGVSGMSPSITTSYANYSVTYTVPSNAQFVFLTFNAYRGASTLAHIYIDDVVLTGTVGYNPNWVEVKGIDHRFVGDVVVTNGLQLLVFAVAQPQVCIGYLWNFTLNPPAWQRYAALVGQDTTFVDTYARQITLLRISMEEISLAITHSGPASGQIYYDTFRLQRGHPFVRFDTRPVSVANAVGANFHYLNYVATPKILYNSAHVEDNLLITGTDTTAPPADYGYGAVLFNDNQYSFTSGFLYQNPPTTGQPYSNTNPAVGLGDQIQAKNTSRMYGFFAVPFGSTGSPMTANLQAEAETNVAAPWVSATTSLESGNAAAKLPSGTSSAVFQYQFNTNFNPPSGTYRWFARIKKGSAGVGTNAEINVFATDQTNFTNISLRPVDAAVSYGWFKGNTDLTFNGSTAASFFVKWNGGGLTSTVDWYVDEAVLVPITSPITLSVTASWPQDLWQQFIYDRVTEIIQA